MEQLWERLFERVKRTTPKDLGITYCCVEVVQ